jgi:hypothetical protein
MFLRSKARPARRADNPASIREPTVQAVWDPQHLTTVQASKTFALLIICFALLIIITLTINTIIKSRWVRQAGNTAHIGVREVSTEFWCENQKRYDHSEDLEVDGDNTHISINIVATSGLI